MHVKVSVALGLLDSDAREIVSFEKVLLRIRSGDGALPCQVRDSVVSSLTFVKSFQCPALAVGFCIARTGDLNFSPVISDSLL